MLMHKQNYSPAAPVKAIMPERSKTSGSIFIVEMMMKKDGYHLQLRKTVMSVLLLPWKIQKNVAEFG